MEKWSAGLSNAPLLHHSSTPNVSVPGDYLSGLKTFTAADFWTVPGPEEATAEVA